MKTSFRKLRGLGLHKHDPGDAKFPPLAPLDELAKASKDMEDMTDCYDNLLSAAAAVANSAYEFSVSLQEMGACFLQRITLSDDEEAGEALMILGKVQFEIQKLVNNYRSHIFKTITVPSESLLNELQIVEEMKRQCDEKRELYESMRTKQKEKGRSKGGKGESFSPQQLEAAREEFDEEATLLVFRLKSLKEGQTRSLLTQASRHYAAQLSFFRKALNSLEAVEPLVKLLTEHQHIEYHFSGLDNDESEDGKGVEGDDTGGENDNDSGSESPDDEGELGFDHHHDDNLRSHSSAFRNSIEENIEPGQDLMRKEEKLISQSAPLVPPREVDPGERMTQLRPSFINKFHAYALPKPGDAKGLSLATRPQNPASQGKASAALEQNLLLLHSVPLETKKHDDEPVETEFNPEKIQRHSFSGPLTTKPIRPVMRPFNGTVPPQISSLASPPIPQQSRANELHELPKPPSHLSYHPASKPGFVGYSAPLMSRNPEKATAVKPSAPPVASALPTPPPLPLPYRE